MAENAITPLLVEATPTGYRAKLSWEEVERFLNQDTPPRFRIVGIPVSGSTDLLREFLLAHKNPIGQ